MQKYKFGEKTRYGLISTPADCNDAEAHILRNSVPHTQMLSLAKKSRSVVAPPENKSFFDCSMQGSSTSIFNILKSFTFIPTILLTES